MCLNPCCNGIYLMIKKSMNRWKTKTESLNPCCNGIYLMILSSRIPDKNNVLILVVMEYT